MKTKIISMGALFLLLSVCVAGAQNFQNQVLLPAASIPKFVHQLPVAGDIQVVNAGGAYTSALLNIPPLNIPPTPNYNIYMREFQAQILPAPLPASWVWGYLTDQTAVTTPRKSYLGPVVVAERGTPTSPSYFNKLPPGGHVQPLLPVDQTLDWANPSQIMCGINCPPVYAGPIPAAVHIHGGEVEPKFDGGPDAWATTNEGTMGIGFPGNPFTYPNAQQESTIWFHDHALGVTRLNVYAGLAGIYPILDPANAAIHAMMPKFPDHDIPLIIQDRSFDTTGQIFYNLASNPQPNPTVHPFWIPEFIGDVIVVNGKTWPNLNVEPRQYRFRLLNGSNARFYDLTMTKGLKFIAIATDGGYLPTAVSTTNVIIGPGERYEVLVDFTGLAVGTTIVMKNAARTPFPAGARPTLNGTDTVMQFTVVANQSGVVHTPVAAGTALRLAADPIQPIINGFTTGTNITRQLTLNEVLGPGGPLELVLNNSKFNLGRNTPGCPTGTLCRETELPAVGDTEIWEIINITADAHPMHTHLVTFQILDRTPFMSARWINQYDAALLAGNVLPGQGPPYTYNVKNIPDGAIGGNPPINQFLQLKKRTLPLPYEVGWKDTAIMYPGEVTRIVVRWAPTDAPVPGVGAPPLCAGTVADPKLCVPQVGVNSYPFDPTMLINGVGYVWHCHIIDHEDNEMMRSYTVKTTRQIP